MKLIKSAIVFSAELPSIDLAAQHLAELPFKPVSEASVQSSGFVPNSTTGELVTPIEGGFSFSVRHDEKVLSRSLINHAVFEAQAAKEKELERDLDEEEVAMIKQAIIDPLIRSALPKPTVVNCFYHEEEKFLIVATTSKDMADLVMHLLINAIGAVKTTTIHVSNVKGGLTTRLRKHVHGEEDAFSGFALGDTCNMRRASNKKEGTEAAKASFSMTDLGSATESLQECLNEGLEVETMELVHKDMAFKLTSDFKLRGIHYFGELTEDEQAERDDIDGAYLWRLEAATQLLQLIDAIKALCELFAYERKELTDDNLRTRSEPSTPEADEPETSADQAAE